MLDKFCLGRPLYAFVAFACLALGVAATAARVIGNYQRPENYLAPGPLDVSQQGMCDFHNGIYFPTRALLRGTSPYGQQYADTNPVSRQIPFFLPTILVLHTPLVLSSLDVGDVLMFTLSVALIVGIGLLLTSSVGNPKRIDFALAISAAIAVSRGGHITLYNGYFTLELVMATFLAIHWGDRRPWLAALALAIVSSKPTHILPLGFLLLFRGNIKAIVIGAIISIVAAVLPMLWLAWNEGNGDLAQGITVLREQIADTQEIHRSQDDESPVQSWTRIDLLAIIAKWTRDDPKEAMHLVVMAIVLIPALWILDRRRRQGVDDGLTGLTGAIILVASIVSLYHQSYDALLLAAPLAGLAVRRLPAWKERSMWTRLVVAGLLLVPLYNYFSTRMILGSIDAGPLEARVFTSINGICLAMAFVILLGLGFVRTKAAESA